MIRPDVLAAVEAAMAHADDKHGAASMGRPFLPPHARVSVLTEELGEVARAVLDQDTDGLRRELERLAGCALGWLGVLE